MCLLPSIALVEFKNPSYSAVSFLYSVVASNSSEAAEAHGAFWGLLPFLQRVGPADDAGWAARGR